MVSLSFQKQKIAIIIPTYNNSLELFRCVESVKKTSYQNILIIIVDDGSEKETYKRIMGQYSSDDAVHVMHTEENYGFAHACNLGARYARDVACGVLFFLNNDAIIREDALVMLSRELEKEGVGIVGPKIYLYDTGKLDSTGGYLDNKTMDVINRSYNLPDNGAFDKIEEVDFVSGCAFMINTELFFSVNCIDESYFLYSEEIDLCHSIKMHGYKIVYNPAAVVWHFHSKTIGSNAFKKTYYLSRSKIYFARKWGNWKQQMRLINKLLIISLISATKNYLKELLVIFYFLRDGIRGNMNKSNKKWLD